MKSQKYLSSLKQINNSVRSSRAAKGERLFSSLYPYRGSGYGWWGQNMGEQVQHFKNWTYVAVNSIASKIASMSPNMAYVSDQPIPGRTVKACHRGLSNIVGKGFGYNGERQRAGEIEFSALAGMYPGIAFGDSGSTWLTVGELRSKALSVIRPHEELEPLEMYHPLRRLFDNPNSQDTFFDLMYESQMFQELCGVSYTWIVPNEMGQPCELWVIPSHWVFPKTGGGKLENPVYDPNDGDDSNYLHPIRGSERLISHFEVRPWGGMGPAGALYIPAEQIIMERWKNPMDKINGYSTLTAVAQWIDLEESISKSRWAQMMNQARPEFWVEMGEGFSDVDNDQIARLESRIAEKLQGEYNYGKPFITPQGTKVSVLSFSPTEMAYFQSEEQVRDMILSSKGVPKSAVGVTNDQTFGSILATAGAYCENCINPRLAMRGATITKHLASKWDERRPAWSSRNHGSAEIVRKVKLWYDNSTPADPAQVNSDLTVDAQNFSLTPNEIRALRGRKPYGIGGDNPIVQGPGGSMPLPINVEEGMEDLGELIGQFNQAANADNMGKGDQSVRNELTEGPSPMNLENDPNNKPIENATEDATKPGDMSPVIEEPNGKPSKSWKSYQAYLDHQMLKSKYTGKKADRDGGWLYYKDGLRTKPDDPLERIKNLLVKKDMDAVAKEMETLTTEQLAELHSKVAPVAKTVVPKRTRAKPKAKKGRAK